MHWIFDIFAGIVLIFALLSGWNQGTLVSLLRLVRFAVAYLVAFFAAKYLGTWIADTFYRPRLIAIPAIGILFFSILVFVFHILISELRLRLHEKEEDEDYKLPIWSRLAGISINLIGAAFSIIIIFWVYDIIRAGLSGSLLPDPSASYTSKYSREAIYKGVYASIAGKKDPDQAVALAQVASHPNEAVEKSEAIFGAPSVQQLLTDPDFSEDFLSGDAEIIQQNASMQAFFEDKETLQNLRDLGVLSGKETETDVAEKLSDWGASLQAKLEDEKVQYCIEQLREENKLDAAKVPELIKDPRFHYIIDSVLREKPRTAH